MAASSTTFAGSLPMLASIALRNLARNRRRTLLSLLVVSVGTASLLLTAGFVRYSFDGLRDAIIEGGLGHFEITPVTDGEDDAASPAGLAPAFVGWREARERIESRPHVRAAGATIQFAGVATNGERSASFLGVAVEPDRERRMGMRVRVRRGADLPEAEPAEGDDRALLGVGLARNLAAEPGDVVTILIATADGSLNALDLTVEGVISTGFQEMDDRILKTQVATAQRALATDAVTSLVVRLDDTGAAAEAERDLERVLADGPAPVVIRDWEARAPFYGQVRGLYSGIFVFLGAIVAVLVALSSSNTLLMSVLERVREFGTLLSIGTSRGQLARLLLLEALWLAALGVLSGSVVGLGLVGLINVLEVEMPPPPAAVDPIELALAVVPSDFLWAGAFMAVLLTLAAVPPMVRVFRLQIVEALGHV
jgi:putative ABC transport system permease protein